MTDDSDILIVNSDEQAKALKGRIVVRAKLIYKLVTDYLGTEDFDVRLNRAIANGWAMTEESVLTSAASGDGKLFHSILLERPETVNLSDCYRDNVEEGFKGSITEFRNILDRIKVDYYE